MPKKQSRQSENFSDTEFYFDDCHICREVGKADEQARSLSAKEFHRIFQEAREALNKK